MNKKELREQTNSDLQKFLKSGGHVIVCKPSKKKVKNPATGSQKLSFFWSEPKNRPSASWDNIIIVR
nr:MAG: hypothetical protein [Caudoviricetes sp.]